MAVQVKRLSLTSHSKVRYELKTPYQGGATHVTFEPVDFTTRLANLPYNHTCIVYTVPHWRMNKNAELTHVKLGLAMVLAGLLFGIGLGASFGIADHYYQATQPRKDIFSPGCLSTSVSGVYWQGCSYR